MKTFWLPPGGRQQYGSQTCPHVSRWDMGLCLSSLPDIQKTFFWSVRATQLSLAALQRWEVISEKNKQSCRKVTNRIFIQPMEPVHVFQTAYVHFLTPVCFICWLGFLRFCISLHTQDAYSYCIPRVCEATERQFKYVCFPPLGCISWSELLRGLFTFTPVQPLTASVCGTLGPPAVLAGIVWLCCVCVRESVRKKAEEKNEKRPPYPLAHTWVLYLSCGTAHTWTLVGI